MVETVFINRRRDQNVGDLMCSPGLYFDLGDHVIQDFSDPVPECLLAVMGGGQVFQDCVTSLIYHTPQARHKVVWSVGISPKDARSFDFDLVSGQADLVSSRNWSIKGCDYVPCVSAMSLLFDTAPAPEHDVVMFQHALKSGSWDEAGVPVMTNHGTTFEQVIAFLASADTVVTNSYHGTYWAMCLGRRVVCVPFSDKFQHFRDPPVMATPDNWRDLIKQGRRHENILSEARLLNKNFYERVRNLGC